MQELQIIKSMLVVDIDSYRKAGELLTQVKAIQEKIKSTFAEQKAAAQETLNLIRASEKSALEEPDETEKILKKLMADYVSANTVKDLRPMVSAQTQKTYVVMVKKFEVIDFDALPAEYKITEPDHGKIGKAVKSGKQVPGVLVWEEPSVRARSAEYV